VRVELLLPSEDEALLAHLDEVEGQEEAHGSQRETLHKEPLALEPNIGHGALKMNVVQRSKGNTEQAQAVTQQRRPSQAIPIQPSNEHKHTTHIS
jgi:hypothetical protein